MGRGDFLNRVGLGVFLVGRGIKLARWNGSRAGILGAGLGRGGRDRPWALPHCALKGLVAAFFLVLLSACTAASPEPTKAPAETKPVATAVVAKPTATTPVSQPTPSSKPIEPTKAPEAVKPLDPPVKVKLSIVGITPDAGTLIALERGYYKEEGLDIELPPMSTASEINPAMATGELSFGSYAIVPAFFNAAARGIDLRIVAEKAGVDVPGMGGAAVIVRKDLYDSGLNEVSKLKGKTIAVNAPQTTSEMYLDIALRKAGLRLEDVNIVAVGFADMLAAMAGKSIDAAWAVEPFVAIGKMRGLAMPLADIYSTYPKHVTYVLVVSPVFAQKNPEAVRRLVTAHLRGQRDYYDAFQKGKGSKDSIIAILIKHTALKDPALYGQLMMHTVNPNGGVDLSIVARDQEYFYQRGWNNEKVDPTKLVDTQYVEYALKRLGKYD